MFEIMFALAKTMWPNVNEELMTLLATSVST